LLWKVIGCSAPYKLCCDLPASAPGKGKPANQISKLTNFLPVMLSAAKHLALTKDFACLPLCAPPVPAQTDSRHLPHSAFEIDEQPEVVY